MPTFRYAVVIRGEIEAKNKENANMHIIMGTTLSLRLMSAPHEIGINIDDMAESANGKVSFLQPEETSEDG